jgi:hypothetical protein
VQTQRCQAEVPGALRSLVRGGRREPRARARARRVRCDNLKPR